MFTRVPVFTLRSVSLQWVKRVQTVHTYINDFRTAENTGVILINTTPYTNITESHLVSVSMRAQPRIQPDVAQTVIATVPPISHTTLATSPKST